MATVYDFSLKDKKGNEVSLEAYKGKVLLIVNTATGCGFTPQYEDLEAMYRSLKEKGLEILDIPCDQFGHQAPGTDEEIHEFCTAKFGTDFPQFKKQNDIQWNFTKFLVNRNGAVVARFESTVDLKEVQKAVEAAL